MINLLKNKKINNRGYSIFEVIIYLAIFSVISIVVTRSFIVILSSFNTTSVNRNLTDSGTIAMERMTREIRQSQSINASSTSTSLILDSSGNTISFVGENNDLNFYDSGTLQGNLLNNNVTLSGINFRRITQGSVQAVKIEMVLQYSEGSITKSVNFYNTVVLRDSY